MSLRVVVVDDLSRLEEYRAAWEALAAAAIEPNVFQEPWFILPAIEAFGRDCTLRFVLVFNDAGQAPELVGVFPLERVRHYRKLPLRHYKLWAHDHCFLATPLVRADLARPCLAAFLEWLKADTGELFMSWHLISEDGPFFQALRDVVGERRLPTFRHYSLTRAVLKPKRDADAYIEKALSSRVQKDLRRRERRLAERGKVEYRSLNGGGDADRWIDDFLEVEASGWKGKALTAMKLHPPTRTFFRTVAAEAARRERLQMHSLTLDGRPIAVQCDFIAGDGAFSYKVAYDENHAACSPGVLLEVENIRRAHRPGMPRWTDSCMLQDHGAPNRMWLDRRAIVEYVTGAGKLQGDAAVAVLPLLRWMRGLVSHRGTTPKWMMFLPPGAEELAVFAEPLALVCRVAV